jgi:hypothetical protein
MGSEAQLKTIFLLKTVKNAQSDLSEGSLSNAVTWH